MQQNTITPKFSTKNDPYQAKESVCVSVIVRAWEDFLADAVDQLYIERSDREVCSISVIGLLDRDLGTISVIELSDRALSTVSVIEL